MEGFITSIFGIAEEGLTGTAGLLTEGARSLVSVFWEAGASGGGNPTILGYCLGLGLGVGAIYFLFRLVKGWISRAKG